MADRVIDSTASIRRGLNQHGCERIVLPSHFRVQSTKLTDIRFVAYTDGLCPLCMVYQMAKEFATRRYQLTINNPKEHGYDHDTIKAILAKGAKLLYWCMCDEEGKEETYHTHLYLVFYNAVMFKTLKNKFPTAHIEVPQWGTNSENYAVAVGVVPCRLVGVVTRTFAAWDVSAFDAVHIDIFPPLFQNELAQCVSRLGDAPSDTRVIADFKVAGLGSFLELFIVVLTAAAAILYAVLEVPKMYTLMQGGCHHVFYWPCKRPSTDVKLVAGRVTALPCLGYSNVSVGPGCALYRDDRFLQLAVEIFRIQCAEDFFKVSSGPGCFDGFFHFCVLTFVFPIFAHVIPSG